jgi:5-methyltetrahydropteroyltriglutamate--homocysteine methyltransferase
MSLLCHEIGSLAKPNWRIRALSGKPLSASDFDAAETWGKRLGLDYAALIDLLKKGSESGLSDEEREEIVHWSSRYAVRLLEKAGLDLVYDGEQFRTEMYEYPMRRIRGMEFAGLIRSFDHKYYRKGAVRGTLALSELFHRDEYLRMKTWAESPIKIPITGPYTLVDWSYDEYYSLGVAPWDKEGLEGARAQLVKDMAEQVLRPNLKGLISDGCEYIQVDEPAATTHPDEVPLFLGALETAMKDLEAHFSVHICFSDYRLLFPHIAERAPQVWEYTLEFANRDDREPGVSEETRPGYAILKKFRDYKVSAVVGLGVIDVHTDFVEPATLVRDRILYAVEVLGGPDRIAVTPDCGLRTRTWEVAYEKLRRMTEGAALASEAIAL